MLDSFVFMIKADSKEAVKSIDKAGNEFDKAKGKAHKATDEIEHDVKDMGRTIHDEAYKIDRETKNIGSSFSDMGSELKSGVAGMAGIGTPVTMALGAIAAAVLGVTNNIKGMSEAVKMANATGMDVRSFNAIALAAKTFGLEMNDVRDTLLDTNVAIANARADAKSSEAKAFAALNIPTTDVRTGKAISAEQVLATAAQRRNSGAVSAPVWQTSMEQLGITDRNFQQVILDPKFGQRVKTAYENGPDQAAFDAAKKLTDATADLGLKWDLLTQKLTTGATPALIDFIDRLSNLMDELNKEPPPFETSWWDGMLANWTSAYHQLTQWLSSLPFEIGNAIYSMIAKMVNTVIDGINTLPGVNLDKFQETLKQPKEPSGPTPGGPDMAIPGDENFNQLEVKKEKPAKLDLTSNMTPDHPLAQTVKPAAPQSPLQRQTSDLTADMAPEHPLAQATVPAVAASSAVARANTVQPLPSTTNVRVLGGNSNTSNTSVNVEKIEVNSNSADPRQVAAAVPGALNDHLSNAAQHFDDGVSH